jgi:hypothetical protein
MVIAFVFSKTKKKERKKSFDKSLFIRNVVEKVYTNY